MKYLTATLLFAWTFSALHGQESLQVLKDDKTFSPKQMLYDYLRAEAQKHFDARNKAIAAITTPEQLRQRQKDLRAKFIAAIGGFPEKTPLNAQVVGKAQKDGYRIEVKDYIGTAPGGSQFLIDRCFAGVAVACGYFDQNDAGAITAVRNVTLNLDRIVASGIDFEADYRIPLGEESAIQLRGIATYVAELTTESFGDAVDRAGQTGNSAGLASPEWILNGTAAFVAPHL